MNSAANEGSVVDSTSIMTIPNEYTSVSLETPLVPSNASGAVHRMEYSLRTGAVGSRSGVMVASPKSVRRARPVLSTRMLSYDIAQWIVATSPEYTYPLEVPMDHVNGV